MQPHFFEETKRYLESLGYRHNIKAIAFALIHNWSDHASTDVAAHIALYTMAKDIKKHRSSIRIRTMFAFVEHTKHILIILKSWRDDNLMKYESWQDLSSSFANLALNLEEQEKWIDQILTNHMAKLDLAISTFDYEQNGISQ